MGFKDMFRFSVHAVIFNEKDEVLLLKQSYGDKRWGLPGGGVEPGETIHEAIIRECLEEIGSTVIINALTGLYYHKSFNAQVVIFKCSLRLGASITLSDEHTEYKWANMDALGEIQRLRVQDALEFSGQVKSRAF